MGTMHHQLSQHLCSPLSPHHHTPSITITLITATNAALAPHHIPIDPPPASLSRLPATITPSPPSHHNCFPVTLSPSTPPSPHHHQPLHHHHEPLPHHHTLTATTTTAPSSALAPLPHYYRLSSPLPHYVIPLFTIPIVHLCPPVHSLRST